MKIYSFIADAKGMAQNEREAAERREKLRRERESEREEPLQAEFPGEDESIRPAVAEKEDAPETQAKKARKKKDQEEL
jgi:hypothetical protein